MDLPIKSMGIGLLVIMTISCTNFGSDRQDQTYLARVGSSYLTLEEARKQIPDFNAVKDSNKALAAFRDQWIQRQVLLKEAGSLQLDRQQEVQNHIQKAREEVLIQTLKKAIISKYQTESEISDVEARRYLRQHQEQLALNERYVKFRHIETTELSRAREARNQLENDSSWTKIARTFSLDAEEKIRSANQFRPVSVLFNDFSIMKRYVSNLESGQISPIQRHRGHYHFIQLTAVRDRGDVADAAWFSDELKEWLIREKQRKYYNTYVKNLYFNAKENNEIEVFNVSTLNLNDKSDSIDTTETHE